MKIKVLRNQGLLQTLEKFQVLQTWIFFQFVTWIMSEVVARAQYARGLQCKDSRKH